MAKKKDKRKRHDEQAQAAGQDARGGPAPEDEAQGV